MHLKASCKSPPVRRDVKVMANTMSKPYRAATQPHSEEVSIRPKTFEDLGSPVAILQQGCSFILLVNFRNQPNTQEGQKATNGIPKDWSHPAKKPASLRSGTHWRSAHRTPA